MVLMDDGCICSASGGLLLSMGPKRRGWYVEAAGEMTSCRNALWFFWRLTLIWQVFKCNLLKMSPQQHAGSQAVPMMTPITIKVGVQELLWADLKWQDTDHNDVHECQTDDAKSLHFSTGEKPLKPPSTFILWNKVSKWGVKHDMKPFIEL